MNTTTASTHEHRPSGFRRFMRRFFIGLLLFVLIFGFFRYYWVFGEGAKAGQLNYMVKKGVMFKTFEGKLIQTGVRGQSGSMQSNEFVFSVTDEALARKLMTNSGQEFNLHYNEYFGTLPWRGMSVFVVDSIISMSPTPEGTALTPR